MLVYSTIKYATGVPTLPLNGATITANTSIWIVWLPEGTYRLPLKFQPSGQSESVAPFEYKGGAGVTFGGTTTVTVTDANAVVVASATFTIGTTTPPAGKEPVTVNVKTDTTKVEVKFTITDSKTGMVTPVN